MSSNKELRKSKHAAYEKKQAEKGERIIQFAAEHTEWSCHQLACSAIDV